MKDNCNSEASLSNLARLHLQKGSVGEDLPSMFKVLSSIPNTTHKTAKVVEVEKAQADPAAGLMGKEVCLKSVL